MGRQDDLLIRRRSKNTRRFVKLDLVISTLMLICWALLRCWSSSYAPPTITRDDDDACWKKCIPPAREHYCVVMTHNNSLANLLFSIEARTWTTSQVEFMDTVVGASMLYQLLIATLFLIFGNNNKRGISSSSWTDFDLKLYRIVTMISTGIFVGTASLLGTELMLGIALSVALFRGWGLYVLTQHIRELAIIVAAELASWEEAYEEAKKSLLVGGMESRSRGSRPVLKTAIGRNSLGRRKKGAEGRVAWHLGEDSRVKDLVSLVRSYYSSSKPISWVGRVGRGGGPSEGSNKLASKLDVTRKSLVGTKTGRRSGKVLKVSVNHSLRMKEKEAEGAVSKQLVEDPRVNDRILDNVFKYCTPSMIDNCRLVSKKWYTASLPVWKANSRSRPIQIECKRRPGGWQGRDGWRKEPSGPGYIFDFVLDFHIYAHLSPQINGMATYSNFALNFDRTSFSSSSPEEIRLDEFWARNGAWITSLKISYHAPLDADFLRQLFSGDFTPQLERLDVQILLDDYIGKKEDLLRDSRSFQLFQETRSTGLKSLKVAGKMTHILIDWSVYLPSYCPKLENLDLSECDWEWQQNNLETILRVIKGIREEDPTRLCLKSLSGLKIGVGAVSALGTVSNLLKELQLDHLVESLSFSYGNGKQEHVAHHHNLVYQELCTLKELSFLRWATPPPPPPLQASPTFRVSSSMAHLASLAVQGKAFDNLSFLRELPVLRSLKLELGGYDDEQLLLTRAGGSAGFSIVHIDDDEPTRNATIISATKDEDMRGMSRVLSSFSCDYYCGGDYFETRDLTRLHGWMPALTRLELHLDNESFRAVCQLWPKLQHVTVFGGRIGDKGIVGLKRRRDEETGVISTFATKPNITNLQDLQSFVVMPRRANWLREYRRPQKKEGDGDGEFVSVYSVEHGFAKLPRLEQLTLDKLVALGGQKKTIKKCIKRKMPLAKINWL